MHLLDAGMPPTWVLAAQDLYPRISFSLLAVCCSFWPVLHTFSSMCHSRRATPA